MPSSISVTRTPAVCSKPPTDGSSASDVPVNRTSPPVIAAAIIVALRHRFTVVTVRGPSMQPALQPGDTLLARRTRGDTVRNGDVIILRVPVVPGESDRYTVVKRVAATAGDPIPAYLPPATRPGTGLLPAGQLAVLGDNAASSADSRVWGLIPAGDVLAKVIRKL